MDEPLSFSFRIFGKRKLAKALSMIAEGPVLDVPEATRNAMTCDDDPILRFVAASRRPLGGPPNDFHGLISRRTGGVESFDVRAITGVFGSKSSGMTWEEFRSYCGKPNPEFGPEWGCDSPEKFARLMADLGRSASGIQVCRLGWSGKTYWQSGAGGGSHRFAAVADWACRTETKFCFEAKVEELGLRFDAAALSRYTWGVMPRAVVYRIFDVLHEYDGRPVFEDIDAVRLTGREDEPPLMLLGLPDKDMVVSAVRHGITTRADWFDVTAFLGRHTAISRFWRGPSSPSPVC